MHTWVKDSVCLSAGLWVWLLTFSITRGAANSLQSSKIYTILKKNLGKSGIEIL